MSIGIPHGDNISPLLANIMPNELDKGLKDGGLNFVRYADDCIIMVGSNLLAQSFLLV